MKHLAILATAAVMLLSGCATTISSNVTAFNAWPADIADKSYAFEAPQGADDTLEYRNYQVLVAKELGKLGFQQVQDNQQPKLLVGMKFFTIDHPVRVLQAKIRSWDRTGVRAGAVTRTGAIRAGPIVRSSMIRTASVRRCMWKSASSTSISASCA
jgi:hypothetical protein